MTDVAKATEFSLSFFLKQQKAFKTTAGEYRKTITIKRERAQGHIYLEHYMNWHMACVFIAKRLLVCLLISIVFTPCFSYNYLSTFSFVALFETRPYVWMSIFSFYDFILSEIPILNNCHKTNKCAFVQKNMEQKKK